MRTLTGQSKHWRMRPILATLGHYRQLIIGKLFDNIRGNQCLLCLQPAQTRCLCAACLADLPWQDHACAVCALPLPPPLTPSLSTHDDSVICAECRLKPPPWQQAQTVFHYQFPIDRLIAAFKYQHQLALTDLFADLMAARIAPDALPTVIVPVPLHRNRLRERGYDQTLLLARTVARLTGLTCNTTTLQRLRDTPMQKTLDRDARRDNLAGAFGCAGHALAGQHILLIDDVLTTGATLSVLSEVLLNAGAESVHALVIARTLPA
ncbi:MAG: ComF family protein [Pseudomonadota bacterium]